MKDHLTCGAQWCRPCPHGWRDGVICKESERILTEAMQYGRGAQAALDWYDVNHPEDFFGQFDS